jgi:Icc-related predicted phosphoesterase
LDAEAGRLVAVFLGHIVIPCLFVSDLHGNVGRYEKLFRVIEDERPAGVFLGGDLLPHLSLSRMGQDSGPDDFVNDFLAPGFDRVRKRLGENYPQVFIILGNDDPRIEEAAVLDVAGKGLWSYAHERTYSFGPYRVTGYAFVPPTPFQLKDWERYDISRFVDPGCVSPEDGWRTTNIEPREIRFTTIAGDLDRLAGSQRLDRSVFLFHSPPYQTALDRAALDGKHVDHAPLDVHVGSIAIKRFIEARQPFLTLHGHVHESARLTGAWREKIGRTHMFTAAHDGPELALVRFDLEDLESARRDLI